MPRPTPTRYIPFGSVKVADKRSDAVAYVYASADRPAAVVYYGKQSKPVLHCRYRSEANRNDAVRRYFKARQDALEAKVKHAAEEHTLQIGDILRSLWGYEQTNCDFYEVVAVSKCMVTLRELAQVRTETDWARGKCVPQSGEYKGEPFRRKADKHGVLIESYEFASKWGTRGPSPQAIPRSDVGEGRQGGIVTGKAENWTAYH